MLFLFAVMYFDELSEAFEDLSNIAGRVVESEKNLANQLKQREELMAELDDVELDEEELEATVELLMKSSPNRIKLNTELDKLYSKMRG